MKTTTEIKSGTVKGETIAQAMANARLIAAAPELLVMLEEVTGALEKLAFPRGVKKAYSEMVVAASARKLIAKAKGEIL